MSQNNHSSSGHDPRALWATIADREARLLALVEASAQIVWVTDERGYVQMIPPETVAHLTWSAFTGYPQEEMGGHDWLRAVHPEDAEKVKQLMASVIRKGEPFQSDFRVHHRSGEWRWVTARGIPVRIEGAIRGWVGTCTDITPAKNAERALRDSQERLLAAMEAGEISTWIWRIEDNTIWWDEAGEKLWGLDPDPNREHDIETLLKHVHVDDRDYVRQAMVDTLKSGIARHVEFRTERTDGRLQWISSRGRVEHDERSQPVRVVGAFSDITKLKEAEESLRQAQKMQALGTLAGGIAHDFNNLLLAISGNVRLAITSIPASDPAYATLQEAMKAGGRATDLVRRILAFASKSPRGSTTTPVCEAVQDALSLVRVSVPGNIELRTRLCNSHEHVELSETELQQIIVNLVTNAVYAIGTRAGKIDVTVDVREGRARLSVQDNGCGMDTSTLERVFDPFFTTKGNGKGTGLGLSVVHGLVTSARGTIAVDSELNSGTTFFIELPISAAREVLPKVSTPPTPRGAGQRILYVDDDEAIVMLIDKTLSALGYKVQGVNDSRAAAQLIKERPDDFDVIVTDLSMPQLNGFDLARIAKEVRSSIPIIVTSGYVRETDREQAAALGIDYIILKPNTIDELGKALDLLFRGLRERD